MIADDRWIRKTIERQEKALAVLQKINPQLYESAVQFDTTFNNFVVYGPKLTPPIESYYSPDGEYTDTTKAWS